MTNEGSMVEAQAARGEDQGGSIKELIEFILLSAVLLGVLCIIICKKFNLFF